MGGKFWAPYHNWGPHGRIGILANRRYTDVAIWPMSRIPKRTQNLIECPMFAGGVGLSRVPDPRCTARTHGHGVERNTNWKHSGTAILRQGRKILTTAHIPQW